MSIAAHAWEQLEASGHRVHFVADPAGRRARVEMHDLTGRPLLPLQPSEALQIASAHPDFLRFDEDRTQALVRQNAASQQTPRKLI